MIDGENLTFDRYSNYGSWFYLPSDQNLFFPIFLHLFQELSDRERKTFYYKISTMFCLSLKISLTTEWVMFFILGSYKLASCNNYFYDKKNQIPSFIFIMYDTKISYVCMLILKNWKKIMWDLIPLMVWGMPLVSIKINNGPKLCY